MDPMTIIMESLSAAMANHWLKPAVVLGLLAFNSPMGLGPSITK